MKHNAYTTQPVRVYRVWGEPQSYPETWDLPIDTPVMVVYSRIHQCHIVSITTPDYRYDAFIYPGMFRIDPALTVDFGPKYYLDNAKIGSKKGLHHA